MENNKDNEGFYEIQTITKRENKWFVGGSYSRSKSDNEVYSEAGWAENKLI